MSGEYLKIHEQIELIRNQTHPPDFIINIKVKLLPDVTSRVECKRFSRVCVNSSDECCLLSVDVV